MPRPRLPASALCLSRLELCASRVVGVGASLVVNGCFHTATFWPSESPPRAAEVPCRRRGWPARLLVDQSFDCADDVLEGDLVGAVVGQLVTGGSSTNLRWGKRGGRGEEVTPTCAC
eukprot:scaffold15986_cov142-Isochrysis_galbana.AAC.5